MGRWGAELPESQAQAPVGQMHQPFLLCFPLFFACLADFCWAPLRVPVPCSLLLPRASMVSPRPRASREPGLTPLALKGPAKGLTQICAQCLRINKSHPTRMDSEMALELEGPDPALALLLNYCVVSHFYPFEPQFSSSVEWGQFAAKTDERLS